MKREKSLTLATLHVDKLGLRNKTNKPTGQINK